MNFLDLIDNMPETVYQSLCEAVETGKWQDGRVVDSAQRENMLQAIMAWQAKHLNSDQLFTVGADGNVVEKSRSELKKSFAEDTIVRFKHDDI
ncbi:hypothetical protein DS2_00625 [Catenovulum agarivorans DS-2]|uniref:Uncharacterized protein n=1 Tax=Catenovulum agarivorans DS-2 TaxID=1328313 RepID=W7QT37_9ALTE|nr:DUF1315 family protein [Catenovulum agarivorans]EWH12182.1 hypothetical protein DS2_00625 [Catenovulum agarivorans DS-2]